MLGEYKGDDDGWKKIPARRINVTRAQLKELRPIPIQSERLAHRG